MDIPYIFPIIESLAVFQPSLFVAGAQILEHLQPSRHPRPAVWRAPPARCRPEKPKPLGASQSRRGGRQRQMGQQAEGYHGQGANYISDPQVG